MAAPTISRGNDVGVDTPDAVAPTGPGAVDLGSSDHFFLYMVLNVCASPISAYLREMCHRVWGGNMVVQRSMLELRWNTRSLGGRHET